MARRLEALKLKEEEEALAAEKQPIEPAIGRNMRAWGGPNNWLARTTEADNSILERETAARLAQNNAHFNNSTIVNPDIASSIGDISILNSELRRLNETVPKNINDKIDWAHDDIIINTASNDITGKEKEGFLNNFRDYINRNNLAGHLIENNTGIYNSYYNENFFNENNAPEALKTIRKHAIESGAHNPELHKVLNNNTVFENLVRGPENANITVSHLKDTARRAENLKSNKALLDKHFEWFKQGNSADKFAGFYDNFYNSASIENTNIKVASNYPTERKNWVNKNLDQIEKFLPIQTGNLTNANFDKLKKDIYLKYGNVSPKDLNSLLEARERSYADHGKNVREDLKNNGVRVNITKHKTNIRNDNRSVNLNADSGRPTAQPIAQTPQLKPKELKKSEEKPKLSTNDALLLSLIPTIKTSSAKSGQLPNYNEITPTLTKELYSQTQSLINRRAI